MLSRVILALAMASGSSAAHFLSNSTDHLRFAFDGFKEEYGRVYGSPEEDAQRFKAFVATLELVDERNAAELRAGGTAQHGITRFADLTQEEFQARYLTTKMPAGFDPKGPKVNPVSLKPPAAGDTKDWTGVYSTPVKNQGYCGSCWAFSVSEQLESDSMRELGTSHILAPQELVSCDTDDAGCNGGWPTTAYDWIKGAGGQVGESDYPYTSGAAGVVPACDAGLGGMQKLVTVRGYYTLTSEASMASHALSTGPIAVAVDASAWSTYTGGVMAECGDEIDHAVQITGVDVSADGYWKVRNSWGTGWGESGFIRLAYGADTCAITTIPTYVKTAAA